MQQATDHKYDANIQRQIDEHPPEIAVVKNRLVIVRDAGYDGQCAVNNHGCGNENDYYPTNCLKPPRGYCSHRIYNRYNKQHPPPYKPALADIIKNPSSMATPATRHSIFAAHCSFCSAERLSACTLLLIFCCCVTSHRLSSQTWRSILHPAFPCATWHHRTCPAPDAAVSPIWRNHPRT